MEQALARIVFAGTGSGCGKTTVTCAVLRALTERGTAVSAFKCGPDYIDPMFHRSVTGSPGANLDPFFFDANALRRRLACVGAGRDIAVIEGVMGYYDGIGMSDRASTFEVAHLTQSPAVLVVNACGAALSVLATVRGFLSLRRSSGIRGVIFNQCSAPLYQSLARELEQRFDGRVLPLGFLPPLADCSLESRRLGLVTAAEVAELESKLQRLAREAERSIDLDGLLALAQRAPALHYQPTELPRMAEPVRIGVARDAAFCFYYEDSLAVLEELGACLVPFSPLADEGLPPDVQGLYLGGGYPELYAAQLSENAAMRAAVRAAVEGGMPCIAECGGFMYLTESIGGHAMVGVLSGGCFDAGKLTRFGYVQLTAKRDNLLCRAGESIRGHEFHYWDCTEPGTDFTAERPSGRRWDCVCATERLYAGFPHFHFEADTAFAVNFYNACLEEKHEQAGKNKSRRY